MIYIVGILYTIYNIHIYDMCVSVMQYLKSYIEYAYCLLILLRNTILICNTTVYQIIKRRNE